MLRLAPRRARWSPVAMAVTIAGDGVANEAHARVPHASRTSWGSCSNRSGGEEVRRSLRVRLALRMDIVPLFSGFPGASDRGFLGWSSCVLLRGRVPMLFDTLGYPERAVLLRRLAEHGGDAEQVGAVFLSHFHFDHAQNYRLFPNAALYLHEVEFAYAQAHHRDDLAVPIEVLSDLRDTGRLHLLQGDSGTVEGVDWFLAPGHTEGSYALRIPQGEATWVLASDAVKNLAELSSGRVAMTRDPEASERSITRIAAMADVVVPGHDRPVEVTRGRDGFEFRPLGSSGVTIRLADGVPGRPRVWRIRLGDGRD